MNKINFNNLTNADVLYQDLIEDILLFAIKKEEMENVCFDIIFVDNKYIHELNKNYRNIDRETDVITFALEDDSKVLNGSSIRMLGDIYVSIEKAEEQAKEYNHSLKRELAFLCVHGFYHLLGYDHMTKEDEEVMFKKQEEILEEFNIKREV